MALRCGQHRRSNKSSAFKDAASAELVFGRFWNRDLETAFNDGALVTHQSGPDTLIVSDESNPAGREVPFDQVYRLPTDQFDHLLDAGAISVARAKELAISGLMPERVGPTTIYQINRSTISTVYLQVTVFPAN